MTTDALYEKAADAVERQNYDYAIELLYQLIRQEPTNVKARQTLWLAEKRKFGDTPPSKSKAFFDGMGPWLSSQIHALMGKPLKVMEDCERALMVNPYNAIVRNKLAQAAYELEDIETAIAAYESAREIDPQNINTLRQLGRLYKEKYDADGRREDMVRAMERFEELLTIRATDHEAKTTAQMLAAQRAIEDGGWQDTKDYRDVIHDEAAQVKLQEDERIVRTEDDAEREIKRLEQAIEEEPTRGNLYVRRGDLLLQKKRFKSAEESFKKAYEIDSINTFTRARLGEVKIQFMTARIEQLKEKLQETPDDAEMKRQIEDSQRKLNDFTIKEYRQRVKEQPTNMEAFHQLGQLLFARDDYDGAMLMFQKSVADPRYRLVANHMLGKCLVRKKMYDRAISMFHRAVDGAVVMNQRVKAVYYDLGETCEGIEDYTAAEQAYGKIYDSDVGYLDIGRKMEEIYRKAREKRD